MDPFGYVGLGWETGSRNKPVGLNLLIEGSTGFLCVFVFYIPIESRCNYGETQLWRSEKSTVAHHGC